MKDSKLFTPGPTDVPQEIRDAMAQPLVHHRTERFREALRCVTEDLRYVLRTENPVLVLAASGTGAMEAALANVTRPGEKVLVASSGKFGERWREIGLAYGLQVEVVDARWGDPVTPDQVASALERHQDAVAVFAAQTETSTGILQDVEGISRAARAHRTLIVIDAIASLCAQRSETDAWGLDVVIGGSQKGFGVPPGLSFLSLSKRAIERLRRKGHARYYFDLSKALEALDNWDTPYTPAISHIMAMRVSLSMIRREGLENVIGRHERNASAVRAAVQALALEVFASVPCNATTAVLPGEGSAGDIVRTMETKYGVKIAGGQARLKGKIFRLGHLGYYTEEDIYTLISALEGTLADLGIHRASGRGVEALLERFHRG